MSWPYPVFGRFVDPVDRSIGNGLQDALETICELLELLRGIFFAGDFDRMCVRLCYFSYRAGKRANSTERGKHPPNRAVRRSSCCSSASLVAVNFLEAARWSIDSSSVLQRLRVCFKWAMSANEDGVWE